MIDTTQILWDFLAAVGTGLYALVGTRIFGPESEPSLVDGKQKAIVMSVAGEGSHFAANSITTLFRFNCYGGTNDAADAREVYMALYDRLHGIAGEDVASGRINIAEQVTATQGPADPKTGWPMHTALFQVTTE